jgi:hypothetical protein
MKKIASSDAATERIEGINPPGSFKYLEGSTD